MSLYVSKPQHVDAWVWDDTDLAVDVLWTHTAGKIEVRFNDLGERELYLYAGVDGAQGLVPVPVGHWIVRKPGDPSDVWPVDPAYFAEKYEPADP